MTSGACLEAVISLIRMKACKAVAHIALSIQAVYSDSRKSAQLVQSRSKASIKLWTNFPLLLQHYHDKKYFVVGSITSASWCVPQGRNINIDRG